MLYLLGEDVRYTLTFNLLKFRNYSGRIRTYVRQGNDGDLDAGMIPVGQSIGLIHDVVNYRELLERMIKEAEDILQSKGKRLNPDVA